MEAHLRKLKKAEHWCSIASTMLTNFGIRTDSGGSGWQMTTSSSRVNALTWRTLRESYSKRNRHLRKNKSSSLLFRYSQGTTEHYLYFIMCMFLVSLWRDETNE
mmetsp:Transcript_8504/g.22998  ORF Transcript_8504/g.22998 Transcript_8504/m.22998 type:complete len:104 (+) Transcript_8504:794-1105(+)